MVKLRPRRPDTDHTGDEDDYTAPGEHAAQREQYALDKLQADEWAMVEAIDYE